MYYNRIRLRDPRKAEGVELPFLGALPTDRFLLKGADGLDGPQINNTFSTITGGGGYYAGSTVQTRQITLLVALNPDYENGDMAAFLRSELYTLQTLRPKDKLQIEFMSDLTVVLYTEGRINRIAAPSFAETVEAQIVIDTDSAYLKSPTDNYAPLESQMPNYTRLFVSNPGDAPTPFTAEFTVDASYDVVYLEIEGENVFLAANYPVVAGDLIMVSTIPGNSYFTHTRGGITTNLISKIQPSSEWFQLGFGESIIRLYPKAQDGEHDLTFYPRYWGV